MGLPDGDRTQARRSGCGSPVPAVLLKESGRGEHTRSPRGTWWAERAVRNTVSWRKVERRKGWEEKHHRRRAPDKEGGPLESPGRSRTTNTQVSFSGPDTRTLYIPGP